MSSWSSSADFTGVAFGAFAGDDPDTADLRREAKLGLAVSLVRDDGEVIASWRQVDLCLPGAAWRDDAVVLCEDLEVVEDGRVIDGEPAPYFRATRVSSYGVADGRRQWTTELPGLVACERAYEQDDLYGELITADGERDRYRRATTSDVWQLCDGSGELIDPTELLATGELAPDWFGYHPDLDDDREPEGADRWLSGSRRTAPFTAPDPPATPRPPCGESTIGRSGD